MEQTMELRGRLGFLEDQVKLAVMAFQEGDVELLRSVLTLARAAIDDIYKFAKLAAA